MPHYVLNDSASLATLFNESQRALVQLTWCRNCRAAAASSGLPISRCSCPPRLDASLAVAAAAAFLSFRREAVALFLWLALRGGIFCRLECYWYCYGS